MSMREGLKISHKKMAEAGANIRKTVISNLENVLMTIQFMDYSPKMVDVSGVGV